MRTDINILNEIADAIISGDIDVTNLKDGIASHQEIDLNNDINISLVDDIVYDLKSVGVIIPDNNTYRVMDADIFNNIDSNISNIAYASEDIKHEDGSTHTRLSPVNTEKAVFLSTDTIVINRDSLENIQPWDDTKINNAKKSNPVEFDFTKCDNIEMIYPQLLAEISNTPGVNGEFCATFPTDKEIYILQGDAFDRLQNEELVFQNGDAIMLNGFTFTYNEELNGFVRNQVAVDTTKESELDSQIPESLNEFDIYMSQEIADKVLNNEELTAEEAKKIINGIKESKEDINQTSEKPKVYYTGDLDPSEVINTYSTSASTYAPAHPGDIFETNLSNKLNEIEYRRIEAEARINQLRNSIRDERRKMFAGPWFVKLGKIIWQPFKLFGRLVSKLLGREIQYSPYETKIKELKEELDKEYKEAIRIKKEQKNYIKTFDINVEKGDTVIDQTITQQEPTPKIDDVTKEPVENEQPTQNTQTRQPNVAQVFGNMFQGVCQNQGIDVNAYNEKNADGKYITAIELSNQKGEITKFEFDANKGELKPVSFSVEQSFTPEMIADLQNKAYITYTIAAIKSNKDVVSDKYINYINEKSIAPLLSGERKEAEFKMGCIPVSITSENGLYHISINHNKETNTKDLEMRIPSELLQTDTLKDTMFQIKSMYASTMYKSFANEQFIDFVKDSAVIKNIENSHIAKTEKINNEIIFDVKLPDEINNNEMVAKLRLNTENFSIEAVNKDDEELMTGVQKVAFSKTASKLETAYASFIFSKFKMPPDIALPGPDNLSTQLNKNIKEVPNEKTDTFFAYGLKIDVNKEENEYPTIRISTKDNNILTEMPLYDGELGIDDLQTIYDDIIKGLETEARLYDKTEAAILNAENKEVTIDDYVLDENYADAAPMFEGNENSIAAESAAIDNVLSTIEHDF